MTLYSVDIQICATAYIKAKSKAEAAILASKLADSSPDILDSEGDVPVCGYRFDDPRLPKVSLSPAMTIHGVWPGAIPDLAD